MSLRPATADDARGIARAQVRAWRHAYADLIAPDVLADLDVDGRAERWAEILAAGESTTWVWDQDGYVAGFASLGGEELLALYVDPAAQGAGVGKALFEHAVAAGAQELRVFEANGQGREFYEDRGWTLAGPAGESMGLPVVRYRCSSP